MAKLSFPSKKSANEAMERIAEFADNNKMPGESTGLKISRIIAGLKRMQSQNGGAELPEDNQIVPADWVTEFVNGYADDLARNCTKEAAKKIDLEAQLLVDHINRFGNEVTALEMISIQEAMGSIHNRVMGMVA